MQHKHHVGSFTYEHIPGPTWYQLNLLEIVPGICSFYTQIIHLILHSGYLDYTDWEYCGHPTVGILPYSHFLSFYSGNFFSVLKNEWLFFFFSPVIEIRSSKIEACKIRPLAHSSPPTACFYIVGKLRIVFTFFND